MRDYNDITGEIIDASYRLHTRLGPELLEQVYETLLARSLEQRGLKVETEKPISFQFDGIRFDGGFRVDLLVEERVVVELKSLEKMAPVHAKQLLTYLRLLDLPIGLLINFGAARLSEGGVERIVNARAPGARALLDGHRAA